MNDFELTVPDLYTRENSSSNNEQEFFLICFQEDLPLTEYHQKLKNILQSEK